MLLHNSVFSISYSYSSMFIITNALRRSDFMLHLNQVLNLLIAKKLCSHTAYVKGNAQNRNLIKTNTFGNFCLSQTLMAFARLDGRSSTGTSNHFLFHSCNSRSMMSGLGKPSENCSIKFPISNLL